MSLFLKDAESYTLFAELFNPVIEDYHGGFKSTDKHPPTDFGDLNTLVNVDPNNEFVISTRVRCGRSLKGYPFNPCLTEAVRFYIVVQHLDSGLTWKSEHLQQYKEMEEKVKGQLTAVEGELKGTYYPLTGMDKKTQQQLIDDHFLFKEGDRYSSKFIIANINCFFLSAITRFLQAANACRYWPSGRGIYHNDNKTFLVWVNEEGKSR